MGQARQYSMQLRKTVFWCKYLSTFLKQTQPSCFAGTGGFQTTLSSLELSRWSVSVSGYKGMAWLISILLPVVAGGSAPWWLLGVSGRLSKLWLSRLHLKYSYQANLLRKDILQLAQHHIVPLLPARNSIQLGHTVIPNYSGKICDSEQQGMCNFHHHLDQYDDTDIYVSWRKDVFYWLCFSCRELQKMQASCITVVSDSVCELALWSAKTDTIRYCYFFHTCLLTQAKTHTGAYQVGIWILFTMLHGWLCWDHLQTAGLRSCNKRGHK